MKEGLIKGIGLSEISAADIRKAHAVHPITAVEMEWSLFSRDAEVCKPHSMHVLAAELDMLAPEPGNRLACLICFLQHRNCKAACNST